MIPRNLLYNSKIDSAAALSYKSNIAPQNGTGPYLPGNTITFNIPTRVNLVTAMTENYLKFDCTFSAGATACDYLRFDSCGAHGLIQRIKVRHGSNLLQDIDDYGLLAKAFFDIQVQTPSAYGKYNILAGTRNDLVVTTPTVAAYADISAKPMSCNQVNSGARFNGYATLTTNTAAPTQTYCLNLISLCGVLCPKYFPLFECTSTSLTLEITLVSSAQAAVCSATQDSTFSISNVEYVANMIELGDSAMQTIRSSVSGPLQFVFNDYKMFPYSIPAPAASSFSHTVPIAAKFASVKFILIAIRDASKTALATYYPYSSHAFNMSDYTFRIGPKNVPPKAPSTYPEMFSEVVKAIGSMSDLTYSPSIEMYSYCSNFQKASAAYGATSNATAVNLIPNVTNETAAVSDAKGSGSFYVGLDLENYVNASNKEQFFAGYNSNTDDIYFMPNYLNLYTATQLRYSSFVNIDSLLVFENGTVFANV